MFLCGARLINWLAGRAPRGCYGGNARAAVPTWLHEADHDQPRVVNLGTVTVLSF
jgi:hypothetical protein